MADLTCTGCGEPWELYYVIHEDPKSFERDGALITKCPCCEVKIERLVRYISSQDARDKNDNG